MIYPKRIPIHRKCMRCSWEQQKITGVKLQFTKSVCLPFALLHAWQRRVLEPTRVLCWTTLRENDFRSWLMLGSFSAWFLLVHSQRRKLYDKRDDCNFPIVNFPFICSNIPAAPACEVYISQLIRYSRACGSYQDLLHRGLLLTSNLLNQGFLLIKLKSSLRKFYGRHHDLVDRYGISVSQML